MNIDREMGNAQFRDTRSRSLCIVTAKRFFASRYFHVMEHPVPFESVKREYHPPDFTSCQYATRSNTCVHCSPNYQPSILYSILTGNATKVGYDSNNQIANQQHQQQQPPHHLQQQSYINK